MPVELTVVGSINLDLVARVERLPRAGETLVGTTSCASRAGRARTRRSPRRGSAHTCGWSARSATTRSPTRRSPDCATPASSSTLTRSGTTGIALILVDDAGENQIVVVPGANDHVAPSSPGGAVLCQLEVPDDVVRAAARGADVLRAERRARAARSTSNPTC